MRLNETSPEFPRKGQIIERVTWVKSRIQGLIDILKNRVSGSIFLSDIEEPVRQVNLDIQNNIESIFSLPIDRLVPQEKKDALRSINDLPNVLSVSFHRFEQRLRNANLIFTEDDREQGTALVHKGLASIEDEIVAIRKLVLELVARFTTDIVLSEIGEPMTDISPVFQHLAIRQIFHRYNKDRLTLFQHVLESSETAFPSEHEAPYLFYAFDQLTRSIQDPTERETAAQMIEKWSAVSSTRRALLKAGIQA